MLAKLRYLGQGLSLKPFSIEISREQFITFSSKDFKNLFPDKIIVKELSFTILIHSFANDSLTNTQSLAFISLLQRINYQQTNPNIYSFILSRTSIQKPKKGKNNNVGKKSTARSRH